MVRFIIAINIAGAIGRARMQYVSERDALLPRFRFRSCLSFARSRIDIRGDGIGLFRWFIKR